MNGGSTRRPRVAIDTNVFVSSLIRRQSPPGRVVWQWLDGHIQLVMSTWQQTEITEILQRPSIENVLRASLEERLQVIDGIHAATTIAPTSYPVGLQVRDPKDTPILAAAIAGDADYLVTGDDDLLSLRDDPRIGRLQIVTPREFLESIIDVDDE